MTEFRNAKDGTNLVYIPAGEFIMGSEDGFPAERPLRRITVSEFAIGQHLVTNVQYEQFVNDTGHRVPFLDDPRAQSDNWDPQRRTYPFGRAQYPVILVSWYDACAYCAWAGGRLPTEAEWEKAARGGLENKRYPWGDEISPDLANYDNRRGPTPVGSYPPNNYGLYDMAGNVWEWITDWYDPKYYDYAPLVNPTGPAQGVTRVLRGGAWLLFPQFCRVAYRFRESPDFRFSLIGFRLARSM
ncbi:MAG: formylglycine-generating enzyme family protein [Candidatus Binatia bacterium]